MATKFYLHDAVSDVTGTLPSTEQSSLTADANLFTGVTLADNKKMDKTIGVSQANLTNASTADANPHNYYIMRWVSPKIAQTSVAANTWTLNFANKESNAAANFPVSGTSQVLRVCCYVWKPSNGTKYGDILDGNSGATFNEAGTGETVNDGTFTGAAVSSLTSGDAVIVFEMWAVVTQGTAVTRTQDIYYDGTTENTTQDATVSNHASFLSTPENLAFAYSKSLSTETVTVGESLTRSVGVNRALSTETVTSGETLARSFGAVRSLGVPTVLFDGTNDRIDCTNDATLWSQGLTKFSFSMRVYPTIVDSNFRNVLTHGGANAHGIRLYYEGDNFTFAVRDSGAVEKTANSAPTPINNWYNIVCVYDSTLGSGNLVIYTNKTKVSGNTLTETINNSSVLYLGDDTTDFKGNMKDFRWWTTTALTQTDVNNIYDNSTSAPTPNYWLKMEEGSGNAIDAITGTKVGTLANGAVWDTTISTEKVIASESLNRILGATRVNQEDTTISENLNRAGSTFNRALSTENTTVSENLTRVKGVVRALTTETVVVDESLSRLLAATRTLPETVVVGESLTRLLAANRALSTESTTIGESLNRMIAANRVLATETVTSGENLTRLLSANRSLSTETVVVGESLNRMLTAIRALATQTTVISDQLDYVKTPGGGGGTNYERALSDTVVIGESIARMLAANRTLTTEVTAINENLARSRGVNRSLATENVSIGETLNRLLSAIRALPETTVIGEALSRLLAANRSLSTETTTIGESLTRIKGVVRLIATETVIIGESLVRRFTGTRPLLDTTIISDLLNRTHTPFTIPTQLKSVVQWLRSKYSISTPPKDPSY